VVEGQIDRRRPESAKLGAGDARGAIDQQGDYWVRMNDPEGNEFCVQ
jgi:hypothetical protein